MVRKLKNAENETQIPIDMEYGVKHWKNVKIEKSTLLVLNYGEKSDHKGKWETHIIGPGMCRETIKMWKMRNVQCSTWNMATNLKKSGKLDLDYGEIKDNRGKWDTNNAWPKIWRETLKNEKNEKCTLYELNYGKKTGQQGKWDTHMLRPEIWQETLKRWKMRIVHCRTWNMAQKVTNMEKRNSCDRTWNMPRNTEKREKWKNIHCKTWNMSRKLKNMENGTHTL